MCTYEKICKECAPYPSVSEDERRCIIQICHVGVYQLDEATRGVSGVIGAIPDILCGAASRPVPDHSAPYICI